MFQPNELLNIKEASVWATKHIGKTVTPSNIAYLINYGRIPKIGAGGGTLISKRDLINYYENAHKETDWKKQLGADFNWALSFGKYEKSKMTNTLFICISTKNYGTNKRAGLYR